MVGNFQSKPNQLEYSKRKKKDRGRGEERCLVIDEIDDDEDEAG